jgi:hypothetical protein
MTSQRYVCALILGCVVLSGCSIKAAYNNFDRFAKWQVRDYVDFDERQEAYFDAELERLLYWHRTTELPRYAVWLESLATATAEERIEGTLDGVVKEAIAAAEQVEAKAMPMTIELMLSLTDEQVARLPQRLVRDNEEFMEEEAGLTADEAREAWLESMQDATKRFMGRLTSQQLDFLQTQSLRYQPEQKLWVEYRKRWQAELLNALADRRDVQRFVATYQQLVADRENYYGAEFTAVSRSNEQLRKEVTLGLLTRANDQQRERLIETMRDFAQDFRELAAEAAPSAPPGGGCLVRCPEAASL